MVKRIIKQAIGYCSKTVIISSSCVCISKELHTQKGESLSLWSLELG